TAAPGQAQPGAKPAPADPDLTGVYFYTEDSQGQSDEIPLTGAQLYTDKTLNTLFGNGQQELQKITFVNPTKKNIDVLIIIASATESTAQPKPPCPKTSTGQAPATAH